jgi:c-di-GMP-binding flagellar brake protein YcgR
MSDEQEERRKEPRHKTESGTCAVIDDSYIHLGHIIDISEGGMSFIYAGSEFPTHDTLELSIYLYNKNFFIDKIPARVVSNFKIPHENLFDFVVLMRCCLQFDDLSDNQRIDLINLIQSYTQGYA